MRLALPVWQGRISPVFDVAGLLLLIELANGRETAREERAILEDSLGDRAAKLAELGVELLICAGISQALEDRLAERGIRVMARICGTIDDVLAGFHAGQLGEERFAMPGCCRQRQQRYRGGCRQRHKPHRDA